MRILHIKVPEKKIALTEKKKKIKRNPNDLKRRLLI